MSEIHSHRSSRSLKARIGMPGYVTLLGSLNKGPTTINGAAQRLGWGRDTCYRLIPQFHKRGRLHISEWLAEPGKVPVAVYAYGPGADAQPPTHSPNGRPRSRARILTPHRMSPEVLAFCAVLEALETAVSINDIRDATGIHRNTASAVCAALRREKLGYIERYLPRDNCGGAYVAMFRLGKRRDADYPNAKMLRKRTAKAWRDREAANRPMHELTAALQQAA